MSTTLTLELDGLPTEELEQRTAPTFGPQPMRDYQHIAFDSVVSARQRGIKRCLYVLPTGTGKTNVIVHLVEAMREYRKPALIIAHREELLDQARNRLLQHDPRLNVGLERAGSHAHWTSDAIVASIQTIGRRGTDRLQWLADIGPAVIVVDEAHHVTGDTYERTLERFGAYDGRSFLVGCTATDKRLDKMALHGQHGATFEEVSYRYGIREAIADKWLCQIRGIRIKSSVDMSACRTTAGDYNLSDMDKLVNVNSRNGLAIQAWEQNARDRQTIVFCTSVDHAQTVCEMFVADGYRAACVHGSTPPEERKQILADYAAGRIQILTNCEILTEGFDDPATSCILMLRPTQSWALYVQMVGRGTRIFPGKTDVLVIDVVDNTGRHSLATVPAILDLPPGLDLQGRTLEEAAKVVDRLGPLAAQIPVLQPTTIADLESMIEQVDLLASIETPSEIRKISKYNWLPLLNGYMLECGDGKKVKVGTDPLGNYNFTLIDNRKIAGSFATGIDDLPTAIQYIDKSILDVWYELKTAIMDTRARWRKQPPSEGQMRQLLREGFSPALISTFNKGKAGDVLTTRFNMRER